MSNKFHEQEKLKTQIDKLLRANSLSGLSSTRVKIEDNFIELSAGDGIDLVAINRLTALFGTQDFFVSSELEDVGDCHCCSTPRVDLRVQLRHVTVWPPVPPPKPKKTKATDAIG